MSIRTAKFLKGVRGTDPALFDKTPQIALIGRSNVGKSSVINSLTNQKDLAFTSSFPGRTQEINIFHINKSWYLIDLPGYGFAKLSYQDQEKIENMIRWYFFESNINQKKVVLIIDAEIGPTANDLEMLHALMDHEKDIIVVANKIDKVPKTKQQARIEELQSLIGSHTLIPYSAIKRIGINELYRAIA